MLVIPLSDGVELVGQLHKMVDLRNQSQLKPDMRPPCN